jgi:hypothetical protein
VPSYTSTHRPLLSCLQYRPNPTHRGRATDLDFGGPDGPHRCRHRGDEIETAGCPQGRPHRRSARLRGIDPGRFWHQRDVAEPTDRAVAMPKAYWFGYCARIYCRRSPPTGTRRGSATTYRPSAQDRLGKAGAVSRCAASATPAVPDNRRQWRGRRQSRVRHARRLVGQPRRRLPPSAVRSRR